MVYIAKKKQYQVICEFKDSQDNNKIYHIGDTYPNPANNKVSADRLDELLSSTNKIKKPVIKVVE